MSEKKHSNAEHQKEKAMDEYDLWLGLLLLAVIFLASLLELWLDRRDRRKSDSGGNDDESLRCQPAGIERVPLDKIMFRKDLYHEFG
jgi:hypothetical protein